MNLSGLSLLDFEYALPLPIAAASSKGLSDAMLRSLLCRCECANWKRGWEQRFLKRQGAL